MLMIREFILNLRIRAAEVRLFDIRSYITQEERHLEALRSARDRLIVELRALEAKRRVIRCQPSRSWTSFW